ncbi:MAG TPA: invasion associated locus B family protein [Rhizomicrobium sp.]|nr:invasion associated locus B family protein [Rhizomicrobium sp.]
MKKILKTAIVGLLLASSAVLAQEASTGSGGPQVKRVGDWLVRCFPVQSPSPCDMFQEMSNPDTRQRVVSVSMAYVPSLDRHAMQIAVPLEVALQRGLTIQTSSFTSPVFKYRRCDRTGCYVELPVDNNLVASLSRSAPDAKINVVGDGGKTYALNFSLKGFAAAHDDMAAQARAKAKPVSDPPAAAPAP